MLAEERVERTVSTTAGRAIVEILEAEGVRAVFGIPGGHVLDIYEGPYDSTSIRHVLARHEHAAAAMAAGYAQLTGEPGVCVATAGPGATNLLTAVAEAHVGCLPNERDRTVVPAWAVRDAAGRYRGATMPADFDAELARLHELGFESAFEDVLPTGARITYVDTQPSLPGMLELVERTPDQLASYGRILAASAEWDGVTEPLREG